MSSNADVLIVGGGLAGLCCALRLHQRELSCVRAQLMEWFGTSAKDWRYLRTYRIPHALPMQVLLSLIRLQDLPISARVYSSVANIRTWHGPVGQGLGPPGRRGSHGLASKIESK